jgi:hypothetical protein
VAQANDLARRGRTVDARFVLEERRARLKKDRDTAVFATPADRADDVDEDFEEQSAVLDGSSSGFAPAASVRENKAQVRSNAEEEVQLAR